jgi:hypothetical protein
MSATERDALVIIPPSGSACAKVEAPVRLASRRALSMPDRLDVSSRNAKNEIGGLLELSQGAFDRVVALYTRALGGLALAALEVEAVLGLPPIEFDTPKERRGPGTTGGATS